MQLVMQAPDEGEFYELDPMVPKHWQRIGRAVTARLRQLGLWRQRGSVLKGIDPTDEDAILGMGAWGWAYKLPTTPPVVLKVTEDPSEGPITARVMSDRVLHDMEGVVNFQGLWQLPEPAARSARTIYVLLREYLEEEAFLDDEDEELLWAAREAAGAYNAQSGWHEAALIRAADKSRQQMMEYLLELQRNPDAEALIEFMLEFYRRTGAALADIHPGNIGTREDDDTWVVFDLGHTKLEAAPNIDALPNPGAEPL